MTRIQIATAILAAEISRPDPDDGEPRRYGSAEREMTIYEFALHVADKLRAAADASAPPEETDAFVTVTEAARILGRTRQRVRQMLPQLGGRRVEGTWVVDRQLVLERKSHQR